MDDSVLRTLSTSVLVIIFLADILNADQEYMLKSPEALVLDKNFETELLCEMNIPPDKFQWKFYPLSDKDVYNPKAPMDLNRITFIHKSASFEQGRKSTLKLKANNTGVAGDYQCLAYYGASVVASVPWRITMATLGNFPDQPSNTAVVTVGNTVVWRCEPPISNPDGYIDYYKDGKFLLTTEISQKTKSLIIANVTEEHNGEYRCKAGTILFPNSIDSKASLNLRVVRYDSNRAPTTILSSRKIYTVTKDETLFLECSSFGNPIPKVFWFKQNGEIPKHKTELLSGGLKISNITASDEGVYICNHTNYLGTNSQRITVVYNEAPKIECLLNSTDVKQGEKMELECKVTGAPEPQIVWFLNGYTVANDSAIEAIRNKIYFNQVEKRHAGNLQVFASNVVKTIYSTISIKVIPISTSGDGFVSSPHHGKHNNRKNHSQRKPSKHVKPPKMIPPDKPHVTRVNDEAVVVRWTVSPNSGLPIMFFKVQYRDLGPYNHNQSEHPRAKGSRWRTCNEDIAPHIRSYDVNGLKPDYWYRFRIAAVYSNNDNKLSNNSDKFHLRKLDFDERNPLPVPLITRTESINTTAVKIYWNCTSSNNVSIEGYFINFNLASRAGDYSKQSVDGSNTNSYILSHLQPDTLYDIKLQSFTSKTASEYSQTMRAKTLAPPVTNPPNVVGATGPTIGSPNSKPGGMSNLYIIIISVVLLCGIVVSVSCIFIIRRKWKQKKDSDADRHKPAVEEHHITAADNTDYVVTARTASRPNGCVPSKITITANPLADADNKSQNMIEMTCLAVQNNNCPTQSTVTDQPEASSLNNTEKRVKNREKRRKKTVESPPPCEKYV